MLNLNLQDFKVIQQALNAVNVPGSSAIMFASTQAKIYAILQQMEGVANTPEENPAVVGTGEQETTNTADDIETFTESPQE